MLYRGTRNGDIKIPSAQAVAEGIAPDGGLYLPREIPFLGADVTAGLGDMESYAERAAFVMSKFFTDFLPAEIDAYAASAYNAEKFDCEDVVRTARFSDGTYLLELIHGPTCAFKDIALQFLPSLLAASAAKTNGGRETLILTATSGDTGKAALEGFRDVKGVKVFVFYPSEGVSPAQKLQMITQEGGNLRVCGVNGDFDDCQSGVKALFSDTDLINLLAENNLVFSSANSINWGRLAPQIVYYLSAYASLVKSGELCRGERVNIAVPTGNFGNILAAYYAKLMGLPVNKLICASNKNNVLTDFINTGVYDANRELYPTISPSMDILIASNVERLICLLSDYDDDFVRDAYAKLKNRGAFTLSDGMKTRLSETFRAGFCDEPGTKKAIKKAFDLSGVLIDPHTAVAAAVLDDYRAETGDDTKTITAFTASPFKFAAAVFEAVTGERAADGFDAARKLAEFAKTPIPAPLRGLEDKTARFNAVVEKDALKGFVLGELGIRGGLR
jgi:threonine synthase